MPKETMVTCLPARAICALPIGSDEVVDLRALEGVAVEDFVLQEDDRIGIADRGLSRPLASAAV